MVDFIHEPIDDDQAEMHIWPPTDFYGFVLEHVVPIHPIFEPCPLKVNVAQWWKISTLMVPWLSYSPLNPRFAGSYLAGVNGFFQSIKILSMTSFRREVKQWVPCRRFMQVKEPQAEIGASEQNLSDFSRSL